LTMEQPPFIYPTSRGVKLTQNRVSGGYRGELAGARRELVRDCRELQVVVD